MKYRGETTWATSKYVTAIDSVIESVKSISTDLEAFSQRLTSYYLDSLMSTQKFGVLMLSAIIAGAVLLLGLASIFLDLMYKLRRSSPAYKKLTVVSWCTCCAVTFGFAVFLNFVLPIVGATDELAKLIEPAAINPTFYAKLEAPEDKLKAAFYPCFFGGSFGLIR